MPMIALALALAFQCADGTPPPCATTRAAAVPPRSVAVLYFANRSADSADSYLVDGLTDDIIRRLTSVGRLSVKSSSAVARLRGTDAPPDSVGRVLRVANLVNGTIARSGRRLRVSVELVRASSGTTLWAGQFDRSDADIFDIQAAIADTVAREIAGRLLPGERSALNERRAVNPEAYDLFLQGNHRLARRTPDDVGLAIRHYQSALAIDPGYALAHARIALSYAVALDWGWPSFDVQRSIRAGLAASARALELDSMLADAWTARGYLLRFANARTYSGVAPAFERAIRLAPRDAEAALQYGWALAQMGKSDSAIAMLRRSVALDPDRVIARFTLAWELLHAKKPGGLAQLDTAIEEDPAATALRGMRAWTRIFVGDTAGARADIRQEHRDDIRISGSAQAALAAMAGDTAEARRIAAQLATDYPPAPARISWGAAWVALACAAAGDARMALEFLERIEPQGLTVWWMTQFMGFDAIRRDPAFQRFTEELAPMR